jgi:hypothetical protein
MTNGTTPVNVGVGGFVASPVWSSVSGVLMALLPAVREGGLEAVAIALRYHGWF